MIRDGFYYDEDSFYLEDAYYDDCETDESGVRYSGQFLLGIDKTTGPVCIIREDTRVVCNNAFYNGNNIWGDGKLQKIIIPKSVVAIADDAFDHCQGIEVVNHSKYFSIVNNMLIDNDEHKILGYFGLDDEVVVPDGIERFEQAFSHTTIRKITIPDSVKEIKYLAFSRCKNLQTVVLPNTIREIGREAFFECKSLQGIAIPESVKTIEDGVFTLCNSLHELVIPASVKTIGDNPFSVYDTITFRCSIDKYSGKKTDYEPIEQYNIRITSHSKRFVCQDDMLIDTKEQRLIGYYGNAEFVAIPDGIKVIGNNSFACKAIKQVSIPDSVTKIGNHAFINTQLQEIEIPDSVNEIGYTAFGACFSLKKVKLPKTLKCLSLGIFRGCVSLQDIVIPDSVEHIRDGAFECCKSLKKLTIPASVRWIDEGAFENCGPIEVTNLSDKYHLVDNILMDILNRTVAYFGNDEHIVIPDGTTIIPPHAFAYTSVRRVTIPDSVVRICDYAFCECRQLEEVNFGNDDIEIWKNAFDNCPSLKRIILHGGNARKIKKQLPKKFQKITECVE